MDYQSRKETMIAQLDHWQVDWLMITNLYNIRYLSGYSGSYATLLIGREQQYILSDGRYQEQIGREVNNYQAVIQGKRKWMETVIDTLAGGEGKRIGFEAEHTSVARLEDLKANLPEAEWTPTRRVVEEMRAVKDEAEVGLLRRALEIAENAYQAALPQIREGMTESELAHLLEDEMWQRGAEKESFESLVLFGERASLPHGKPSDRRLQKGDAILTDFGCVKDGYCSDITRMAVLGQPNDELRTMCELVRQANRRATDAIQAGATGVDADRAAREVIDQGGRGDQFIHGLGHGVGLEVHEAPRLSYLSEDALQSGHVVTIEPGVYVPGFAGVRLENMGVVREGGCEILNQTPAEVVVL